MKSSVALSSSCLTTGRSLTFSLVIAVLPILGACQGNLDNGIKQISEGSGGDSGSSTGSGGSSSSGGATGSGGTTGSGGVASSSGGAVGSGGVVGSGGTPATGSGGMASGSGGKAGGSGSAGKSGSGGVVGAGGRKGSGGSSAGGMMGGGSGGSGTVATCDAPTKVFRDPVLGCIDAGCHAKGSINQPPDLETADPTVLKNYKSMLLCMGSPLVVPSDPKSSVLWKVVDGTSCGELMPKGKPGSLDQTAEDCLAAWIANIK